MGAQKKSDLLSSVTDSVGLLCIRGFPCRLGRQPREGGVIRTPWNLGKSTRVCRQPRRCASEAAAAARVGVLVKVEFQDSKPERGEQVALERLKPTHQSDAMPREPATVGPDGGAQVALERREVRLVQDAGVHMWHGWAQMSRCQSQLKMGGQNTWRTCRMAVGTTANQTF